MSNRLVKQRKRPLRLFLALICMLLSPANQVLGEMIGPLSPETSEEQEDMYYNAMLNSIELDKSRWKPFSRSLEGGPWFYDAHNLKRVGKKVTVQVTVYPHPNRTELYSAVFNDHQKIRKIVFTTEIDCLHHSYRQPEIRAYGYYRELLIEHIRQGNNLVFAPINTGTTTDTLRHLVCPPDRQKRN